MTHLKADLIASLIYIAILPVIMVTCGLMESAHAKPTQTHEQQTVPHVRKSVECLKFPVEGFNMKAPVDGLTCWYGIDS